MAPVDGRNDSAARVTQTATALALGQLIISLTFFDRYYAHLHHRAVGGDFKASQSLIDGLAYPAKQIVEVRAALKGANCPADFREVIQPILSRRMALNDERNRLMHDAWVVTRGGYSLLPQHPAGGYPKDFAPKAVTAVGLATLTEEVQRMTGVILDSLFGPSPT